MGINTEGEAMKKKAMLSQPMGGKTDDEIVATREKAVAYLEAMGYEVVNTYFTDEWYSDEAMKGRGVVQVPLCYLAKSLENMSLCHAAFFAKGWEDARGCRIEHDAARDELCKLADRIDREMVELPRDADGVPFHVGDTVYYCNSGLQMKVLSLSFDGQWHLTTNRAHVHDTLLVTHERTDTYQRIADELKDWSEDNRVNWSSDVFDRAAEFAHRIRKLAKEGE